MQDYFYGENTATLYELKLNYRQLAIPVPGEYEPCNIFGVIIDFPVTYHQGDKWMLNLKIVDQSLNQKATNIIESRYMYGKMKGQIQQTTNSFATVTFFASEQSHLPKINRIGDIIRLQKSTCKEFRGQKQFNVNVFANKSEWAIFRGESDQNVIYDDMQDYISLQEGRDQHKSNFFEQKSLNNLETAKKTWVIQKEDLSFQNSENLDPNMQNKKTNGRLCQQINYDVLINHQLYNPFCYSMVVDKYSFHPHEKNILNQLRAWSQQYFNQISLFDPETNVPVAKMIDKEGNAYFRNFDIHGKVILNKTVIEDDEKFFHVLIQDIAGQVFEGKIPSSKFSMSTDYYTQFYPELILAEGTLLRLRGAKLSEILNVYTDAKDKLMSTNSTIQPMLSDVFHLDFESKWGSQTGIMIIPQFFNIAKILNEKIIDNQILSKLLGEDNVALKEQKTISKISKFYEAFEIKTLEQTYFGESGNQENFRVKFMLMDIENTNCMEYCKLFCRACKKIFSFKDLDTDRNSEYQYICPNCQELGLPVYQMSFLIKDQNSLQMEKVYKLHYYTHFQEMDKGLEFGNLDEENPSASSDVKFFFGGLKPTNLYKNEQSITQIQKYLQLMTKSNIFVEAIIQKKVINKSGKTIFVLYDSQLINI